METRIQQFLKNIEHDTVTIYHIKLVWNKHKSIIPKLNERKNNLKVSISYCKHNKMHLCI